jgi:hypothetical protein
MAERSEAKSNIPPLLVAALVCDVAAIDPSSRKPTLVGVFDRLQVRRFPASRSMTVYFKVTDAEGLYEMRVKFVRVGNEQGLAEAMGEIRAEDRLSSYGMTVPFPPLPFESPGPYEFQIWLNEMYLGGASLMVQAQDTSTGGS